jgi:hypothetical protein
MFAANAYSIRFADSNDTETLAGLAERESEAPLAGRVLVGWIDGAPAAALSLEEGRVIADSSRPNGPVVAALRMRAGAIKAFETTPSLRERLLAALPSERGRSNVVPIPVTSHDYDESAPMRAFG